MPLYIGDYMASTSRLTAEQHGAYLLLIMDYWKNGPPPDDDVILSQICRMSNNAWSNASSTIKAFFRLENGRLVHSRIERELAAAKIKKDSAVDKAKDAARARWQKHASSNASSNPQAMLGSCPLPSPLQSTSTPESNSESPFENQTKSKPLPSASRPVKEKKVVTEDETALQRVCHQTWGEYVLAYQDRYGVPPVRNPKVSSQVKQFCQRVSAIEAPAIAAFYVTHNAGFYVSNGHSVGLLLKDAEKLRTEWATNQTVTQSQARQVDATAGRGNVWKKVIAEITERERNEQTIQNAQ